MREVQPTSPPQLGTVTGTRRRVASALMTSLSLIAMCTVSVWLLIIGMGGVGVVEQIVPWPALVLGVLLSLAFMLIASLLRRGDG